MLRQELGLFTSKCINHSGKGVFHTDYLQQPITLSVVCEIRIKSGAKCECLPEYQESKDSCTPKAPYLLGKVSEQNYNFDSSIFRKLHYEAVIVKSWSISARLIWRNEVWVFVIRFKFFQIPLLSSKTQTCSLTVPIVVYGKTPLDVRLLRNQEYKISISQHRKFTPGRNLLYRIQS